MNPRTKSGPVCVSVINMKGGVGKTTITALLGQYAASIYEKNRSGPKRKVLAIDLDPQANLSQAFMRDNYLEFLNSKRPSIVEIFSGYHPPTDENPSPTPLDINDVVIKIDDFMCDDLELIPSRFDFSDNLVNSLNPCPKVLARFISDYSQDKDLVIIDCAPTESIFTQAAYHASRYVLVPVRPEFFATIGFPLLQKSLDTFRNRNTGHHIDVIGVVINNAFYHGGNDGGPEKRRAISEIREEAHKNKWHIFDEQIPHSRGFPKMMRGDFSHPGNASDFHFFAEEFFKKLDE